MSWQGTGQTVEWLVRVQARLWPVTLYTCHSFYREAERGRRGDRNHMGRGEEQSGWPGAVAWA